MATYNDAIDGAHLSLNDPSRVRYPDTATFPYARDGVREVALLRPDLFVVTGNINCVAGEVEQTVAPAGQYIIDVLNVVDGPAVTKSDLDTLRRFVPNWRDDTAGPAENWFPIINDQTKRPQANFFIYPKAPAVQALRVQYVLDPLATLPLITAVMPIPDTLLPAIESYIIFRCEMVDDEHVVTQRAQAAYSNFATILGVSEKARKLIVQEGRPQ